MFLVSILIAQVKATTITVDGSVDEWKASLPDQANSGHIDLENVEFVWRDEVGDDFGSNDTAKGTSGYRYPLNGTLFMYPNRSGVGGDADIIEFRVTHNDSFIFFMVKFNHTTVERVPAFVIAIDVDANEESGFKELVCQANAIFEGRYLPDVQLAVVNGKAYLFKNGNSDPVQARLSTAFGVDSEGKGSFEIGFPLEDLEYYPYNTTWRFYVVAGIGYQALNETVKVYNFTNVVPEPNSTHPGGGLENATIPYFFDICYNGSREEQLSLLNSWNATRPVVLGEDPKTYLEVHFPPGELRVNVLKPEEGFKVVQGDPIEVKATAEILWNATPVEEAKAVALFAGKTFEMTWSDDEGCFVGEVDTSLVPAGEHELKVVVESKAFKGESSVTITVVSAPPLVGQYVGLAIVAISVIAFAVSYPKLRYKK